MGRKRRELVFLYKIITMEREFASGGNEIGRRVAEKLGVKLFDRTILVEAAKRLDISPIYIGDLEETAPGSIIFNLSKTALGGSKKDNPNLPMTEKLFWKRNGLLRKLLKSRTV